MKNKIAIVFILVLGLHTVAAAQGTLLNRAKSNGWDIELRAGVNLGGAAPVPLPVEIRKIEKFNPKLNGVLEGIVTKWHRDSPNYGVSMGVRLEQKGMKTQAMVKNYRTSIENEGNLVAGYWTGRVHTSFSSIALSFPLQLAYKINSAGRVSGGLFFGYRFDGDLNGYVTDGYFRQGTPVGEKMVFSKDQRASYDFKEAINPFEMGMQLGGSWRAYRHFLVFADLKYSFTSILKSDFEAITFDMYPIYLSAGFSYLF